ncbi:MAG: YbaK/EbsC family protein [Rhodococcus sp.]|uniref:YbaK/EbsC family protein n=1 Tax=Rhodococcus TaxID=1827 RepID=UPI0016B6E411|nr:MULTISPECIES: YbaK/EbsC family protein [Rhodococcus]NLV80028.1 YbaK/EbsC family protein [Rhodococcus sp. (in: high G+C Gram-positive bacteria)]
MSRSLHPNATHVADTLIARGHHGLILAHPTPVDTPGLAAAAVHADVGAIVEARVYLLDDDPVLLLVSGAHPPHLEHTAARLDGILTVAPEDLAVEVTGQPTGSIAPVGHPTNLPTYLDRALARFPVLWASGGCPGTLFRTSFPELLRITAGIDVDVD